MIAMTIIIINSNGIIIPAAIAPPEPPPALLSDGLELGVLVVAGVPVQYDHWVIDNHLLLT